MLNINLERYKFDSQVKSNSIGELENVLTLRNKFTLQKYSLYKNGISLQNQMSMSAMDNI